MAVELSGARLASASLLDQGLGCVPRTCIWPSLSGKVERRSPDPQANRERRPCLNRNMRFPVATSSRGVASCSAGWPRPERLRRRRRKGARCRAGPHGCPGVPARHRLRYFQRKPVTPDDVRATLHRAVELGVNYLDTAPTYGNPETGFAEEKMGPAIAEIRDKVFLVTKTEEPTYEGTWKLLRQSLKRMGPTGSIWSTCTISAMRISGATRSSSSATAGPWRAARGEKAGRRPVHRRQRPSPPDPLPRGSTAARSTC